jgi:toxin ParE1/3/4
LTAAAEADLDQILEQLTVDAGKSVATRYRVEFLAATGHLTNFPRSGAPRPKLGRDMRIWTVEPYVIYHRYVTIDDTVLVVRVLHRTGKVTKKVLVAP